MDTEANKHTMTRNALWKMPSNRQTLEILENYHIVGNYFQCTEFWIMTMMRLVLSKSNGAVSTACVYVRICNWLCCARKQTKNYFSRLCPDIDKLAKPKSSFMHQYLCVLFFPTQIPVIFPVRWRLTKIFRNIISKQE